jgi:hypothetical protein
MRAPNKHEKVVRMTVSITPTLKEWLRKTAKRQRRSVSWVVSGLVSDYRHSLAGPFANTETTVNAGKPPSVKRPH